MKRRSGFELILWRMVRLQVCFLKGIFFKDQVSLRIKLVLCLCCDTHLCLLLFFLFIRRGINQSLLRISFSFPSKTYKTAIPEPYASLLANRPLLIDHLKAFDLDSSFGPCVGISRLERFNRARKLKLNPPPELGVFLSTDLVGNDVELREPLWFSESI